MLQPPLHLNLQVDQLAGAGVVDVVDALDGYDRAVHLVLGQLDGAERAAPDVVSEQVLADVPT